MEILRLDSKTVAIREIDPFAVSLIRRIPIETDPGGNEDARGRLFSRPMEGEQGSEMNEEWKQYVEPELRHLFQSANETVSEDIKTIKPAEAGVADVELYDSIFQLRTWSIG